MSASGISSPTSAVTQTTFLRRVMRSRPNTTKLSSTTLSWGESIQICVAPIVEFTVYAPRISQL